jgi:periplasmic protein CpxP/Spy
MNIRKATLVLGALLTTGAMFASAQAADTASPAAQDTQTQANAPKRGMNPERQAKRLGKQLNLSQDQVSQIEPILADRDQQMQALRGDSSLAPADRRAKAKGIMDDSNTKIEAVLNDQQKQQYEQMLASRRSHRGQGGQGAPADQQQSPQAQPNS